ncbi:MAG: glycerophosphodiester phosphodiesterase [Ectothiorhodospiraceae bacterium]|nr:glycerophosphodiester phosphodiesterase [Ectothiorhodospiraceae bacterium]
MADQTHARHAPSPSVRLIAHRGYAAHYPENTLSAFRAAAEAGADAVEMDIQVCADGTPLVIHDQDLQRTANRPDYVSTLRASALEGISVHEPQRFGTRFLGEPLATLAQVSECLAASHGLQVFIEIKHETADEARLPEIVKRVADESAVLGDNRVIISFMEPVVQLTQAVAGLRSGWVLPLFSRSTLERATTLAPDFLFCDRVKLPADDHPLPAGGWEWAVYEVVDPTEALALAARGVNHIETMAVGELREALAARTDNGG